MSSTENCDSKEERIAAINKKLKFVWMNDSFEDESMWSHILGEMPEIALYEQEKRKLKAPKWLESSGWAICGYVEPLLSKEQEQHLFRQYNFLKWRAKTLANKKEVTHAELDEVEDILLRSEQVREQIILCNIRLAVKFVRRSYYKSKYAHDLLSESFIIIQRAVDCFDWTTRYAFSTYLTHSLIKSLNSASKRLQKEQYLQVYEDHSESSDLSFVTDTRTDADFDRMSARLTIESFLDQNGPLNEKELKILHKRFFEDRILSDIGSEYGVSQEAIRQTLQRCYKKIHNWLGEEIVELYVS